MLIQVTAQATKTLFTFFWKVGVPVFVTMDVTKTSVKQLTATVFYYAETVWRCWLLPQRTHIKQVIL